MIKIEINQEDLKRPEVYEALVRLIESLSGSASETFSMPKKKSIVRRKQEPVKTPPIDSDVKRIYGEVISKDKSLYFMSLVKTNTSVDSDLIEKEMQLYYPEFTRKSIGGITGAIQRWFDARNMKLPYQSAQDRGRNGIHIFNWIGFEEQPKKLNDKEKKDLTDRIKRTYKSSLTKLLNKGRIGKEDLGSKFAPFARAIADLKTDVFDIDVSNEVILLKNS